MDDIRILSEREKTLLISLIKKYIDNHEPVGSRTLSKTLELGLSAATIRNIMADLEEKGFLTHPHTSAGRVPTEKGYRFFVDEVVKTLNYKTEFFDKEEYIESLLISIKERAVMLSKISSILSELSHYVGIVLAPNVSQLRLKHIDFVDMGNYNCLVIFVSQTGIVFNRMVHMGEIILQETLDKMSRYVNEQFYDLTLYQINQKIKDLMSDEKIVYDQFLRKSIELSKIAIDQSGSSDIFLEGKLNILDQPEFSTLQKMRSIFMAFEKKEGLIFVMNKYQETDGVQVSIGSENMDPKMIDCSIVMSPYQISSKAKGMLGVIGPIRMRYWDAIRVVERMAGLMNRIFQQIN